MNEEQNGSPIGPFDLGLRQFVCGDGIVDDASPERRVIFEVRAEHGSSVYLAGSFNDWNPIERQLTEETPDGIFSTTLLLPEGRYQYKFVINGVWCIDPECREWERNKHGSLNSVITVD